MNNDLELTGWELKGTDCCDLDKDPERSFRRGFTHGVQRAIEAIRDGATETGNQTVA